MTCNTSTIIFRQVKFLGLKEAHIDILSSARSSITWLIFFEETLTYVNFLHHQSFNDAIKAYADFFRKLWVRLIREHLLKKEVDKT